MQSKFYIAYLYACFELLVFMRLVSAEPRMEQSGKFTELHHLVASEILYTGFLSLSCCDVQSWNNFDALTILISCIAELLLMTDLKLPIV